LRVEEVGVERKFRLRMNEPQVRAAHPLNICLREEAPRNAYAKQLIQAQSNLEANEAKPV
jgi:hypothetical protein